LNTKVERRLNEWFFEKMSYFNFNDIYSKQLFW
jgi:hypothetical protein